MDMVHSHTLKKSDVNLESSACKLSGLQYKKDDTGVGRSSKFSFARIAGVFSPPQQAGLSVH